MSRIRRLIGGLYALLRRRAVEEDLDEELHGYLEASLAEKMQAGMRREDATRAARMEMGSLAALKDHVRDVGWESRLESIWRDARYGLRTMRTSPGFTAAVVLTLALGIGATTAIFSLLDAVILKSLPVKDPEQLVLVSGPHYPVFQAFQRHTDVFVDLCATSGVRALDVEVQRGVRERAEVSLVSGSYFSTLGVQAAVGRTFTANDDRVPGGHPFAVASYGYWQRRFGRDPAILETVVRISGTPVTIIGVAPQGFFGEDPGVAPDLWMPLTMYGHVVPGRNMLESRGTGWLRIIGRVRPGVMTSGTRADLTETFRRVLADIFGPQPADDVRRDIARASIRLQPAGRGLSNLRVQFSRPLQLLLGAAALLLLIACVNIASLLLARATARRREIQVRLALGMSRARLVRQLLTESLLLATLGGAVGIAFASLGREALLRLISADGSRLPVAVATDTRLLVFVVLISSATAIIFGLAPAWHSARQGTVSPLVVRHELGAPMPHLRSLLVVAQVSLSLVLLMGAGLFVRTIANLRDVELGFAPERLLIVDVKPHTTGQKDAETFALNRALLERIRAVPGVLSASLSEHGVLMGTSNGTNLLRPDGFAAGPEGFPQTRWDVVGPGYFSTAGVALLSGRDFDDEDDATSAPVVAINQEMARLFFAEVNPIGRRLLWGFGPAAKTFEIIAVTRDVKQSGPRDEPRPRFYLPYFQIAAVRPNWILTSTRFLVRTADTPATLASSMRQLVLSVDPRLSVASVDLAPDLVHRTLVRERTVAVLLIAFALLAVGLACLGLYGLIAYQVVQRSSEIGVRMALGARGADVVWLMLRRALGWVVAGVVVGAPLALSASRVARSLLFGLRPTDAPTLIVAAIVVIAMGLLAAYIPARRASRVDPLVALRVE